MSEFFMRQAATDARVLKRSCESLLGLCRGLLADGKLTDDEIIYLKEWLEDNAEISETWPGDVVYRRVNRALEDGLIEEHERDHLVDTLSSLVGGTMQETGLASGLSTGLPVDEVDTIIVSGKSFCFTGKFLYGTRAACHKITETKGGEPAKGITKKLDYLVIGTLASRDWANTSFGRKIEKAKGYQDGGAPLKIISENVWLHHVE